MALMICRECGAKVSSSARCCPHCGAAVMCVANIVTTAGVTLIAFAVFAFSLWLLVLSLGG